MAHLFIALTFLLGARFLRAEGRQCPVRVLSLNVEKILAPHQISSEEDLSEAADEGEGVVVQPLANNSGIVDSQLFLSDDWSNFKCQFLFLAAPNEHVQITFLDFSIVGHNFTTRCEETSHLAAHVLVGSRMSKMHDFCGKELPPPLMSTKNLLTLELVIKDIITPRPAFIGFKLQYAFIKGYGKQAEEATLVQDEGDCSYEFNSTVKSSGELWSPNHPGFYPRNLNCEYTFHGKPGQIILIHFEYFDVEGYGHCEDATHSDFVLFSNYKTVDRTNRRFCGANKPPKHPVQSESSYFRMQFKTNDIFDATGFYVYYQFLDQKSSHKNRVKLTSNDGIESYISILIMFLCLVINIKVR